MEETMLGYVANMRNGMTGAVEYFVEIKKKKSGEIEDLAKNLMDSVDAAKLAVNFRIIFIILLLK
jgi:hypothetical protein